MTTPNWKLYKIDTKLNKHRRKGNQGAKKRTAKLTGPNLREMELRDETN